MPPANNLGGQNNLLLFEVGMIRRNPIAPEIPPLVRVLALHPLLVVPTELSYQDSSRSKVSETAAGGAFLTVGGRALRTVSLRGTFGVEDRALGLYFGNGDLRFSKFYHEVVRLPDAVTRDQVAAEKDVFRSPILSLLLIPYDEETTTLYINFYDFWHGISFQAQVASFSFSKSHRNGGATGLTSYNMQLREVGPIVTGSLVTALLALLFKALGVWSTINDQISSFRLDVIAEGVMNLAGIAVQQFVGSVNAVKSMADGATALLNGQADPGESIALQTRGLFEKDAAAEDGGYASDRQDDAGIEARTTSPANGTSGLGAYLGRAGELELNARTVADAVRTAYPDRRLRSVPGRIRWSAEAGEGSIPELDAADSADSLGELEASARSQGAMGALYGMSREEFAAFLDSTGRAGGDTGGAVSHRVGPTDTVASLERTYAVAWDRVLRANPRLDPQYALLVGTVLRIPSTAAAPVAAQVQGLPTFGSHTGTAAWGSDLWADLRTNGGRILTCSGEDVLIQGIDWIVREAEAELLEGANVLPAGRSREQYLQTKVAALVATDVRIVAVDGVDVQSSGPSVAIEVRATAINGGAVSTATAR